MNSYNPSRQTIRAPLYPNIRSFVLSGARLWSMVAFLLLGGAAFIALCLSMLWALDMVRGAGSLYAQFSFLINGANPLLLLPWLGKAVDAFNQARGNSAFDLAAWHLLFFLCLLLFAAHICRFDKPSGESLLLYPTARGVAERLLRRVGYFVDIRMPVGKGGEAGTDFFGADQLFYAPRGHLSRILTGKRSDAVQERLVFFMVHECAHAISKDNLANSAFVVIVALLTFMFLMVFGPLLLIGSTVLSMTPMGPSLTLPLSIVIFLSFSAGVYLSFRGMIVSYVKAREYFADAAGFHFVSEVEAPYGFDGLPATPDIFSALRTGISPFERALHQRGLSLHARDMLIYFWGFFFSIRTLYVLVAPKDLCWTVLGFDVMALGAFACLYVTLPKRTVKPLRRGGLAWFLTFLAVTAVEVCGPGLIGSVMMLYRGIFSNFNAQLIGLPGAILFLVFAIGGAVKGIRYLASGQVSLSWLKGAAGHKGHRGRVLRRLGLFSLSLPGVAVGFFMLVMCGVIFCVIPLNYFLRFGLFHARILESGLLLLIVMGGLTLLFHQYLLLFMRKLKVVAAVSLIEAFLFFLFSCILYLAQADVMQGVRQGVVHATPSLDRFPQLFSQAHWASVLPTAIISTACYLLLRLLAFWAQDTIKRMDTRWAQESGR